MWDAVEHCIGSTEQRYVHDIVALYSTIIVAFSIVIQNVISPYMYYNHSYVLDTSLVQWPVFKDSCSYSLTLCIDMHNAIIILVP